MRERILDLFLQAGKVCTDTRRIESGAIFFALKGENFNGNHFAKLALDAGCSWSIVDEEEYASHPRCILVKDAMLELQKLATNYRNRFDIPVIGITGSNGKTTTKELMAAVLSRKYKVHFTKGNLNNHLGVPLTLLSMPQDTEMAIIEMGANHQREIAQLAEITRPTHALITNIGKAHLEGFGGIEGVKKGKGELFDYMREHGGPVFVNTTVPFVKDLAHGLETIEYGVDCEPLNLKVTATSPTITFSGSISSRPVRTHLTGEYNMNNFAAAIAVGKYFEVADADIVDALESYAPTNQRSQIKRTETNVLILDAYNANPTSMKLALKNLTQMESRKKFFVMGDMLELGEDSKSEHEKIIEVAHELGLEGLLVGYEFGNIHQEHFPHVRDVKAARAYFEKHPLHNNLILIKGSRGIRLEEVVDAL